MPTNGFDAVAAAGIIGVGNADHRTSIGANAEFFIGLAQCGGDCIGIGFVNFAAGKGDLSGMAAQPFGALGQDNAGFGTISDRRSTRRRRGDLVAKIALVFDSDISPRVERGHQSARSSS